MSTDPTQPTPAPQPEGGRSLRDFWAKNRAALLPLVVSLASALVGSVLTYFGAPPKVVETIKEVIRTVPARETDPLGELINRDGVVNDAEAEDADARVSEFRTFAQTPAGQVRELPKQVFLWQAERKLTGELPPAKDQNPEGACVGFGTTTAIERTLAAAVIARNGDPSEFAHFSEEVTYIGSRTIGATAAGGRPMSARSQGSAGVYAKAFVTGTGMVPKGKYKTADLTNYSAARAAQWRSSGLSQELVEVAKKYPVKSAAKVTSWEQFKAAVGNGYGVSICATWSYSRQRDQNGVALPTREGWAHCMAGDGYIVLDDGREFGHIENSWSRNGGAGPYHVGPTGWGNPSTAGFWASSQSIDRALREGHSYAYSDATGFKPKKLDWFVRAEPARRTWAVRIDRVRDPFGAEFRVERLAPVRADEFAASDMFALAP